MIDLHSHVLPEVDDGVRSLREAITLCRVSAAQGVTHIVATPHVRDDWPNVTPRVVADGVAQVNQALRLAGVEIEVLGGGEIALERLPRLTEAEVSGFGLGGNPRLLLLEFPYYGWPLELNDTILGLAARGVVPLIAHPERNAEVQDAPERLRGLVDGGAYVQITAASLDGRLGRGAQASAQRLLDLELAHVLASDAHHPGIREAGLRAAAEAAGPELGRWLTVDVPRALLGEREPPPRPAATGSRRRRWRILR